jgi:uncharacterized membrane protein YccC
MHVLASSQSAIQGGNMGLEHKLRKLDHLNKAISRSLEMITSDIAPEAQALALECLLDLARSRAALIRQIEELSHYPSMDMPDLPETAVLPNALPPREADIRQTAVG